MHPGNVSEAGKTMAKSSFGLVGQEEELGWRRVPSRKQVAGSFPECRQPRDSIYSYVPFHCLEFQKQSFLVSRVD